MVVVVVVKSSNWSIEMSLFTDQAFERGEHDENDEDDDGNEYDYYGNQKYEGYIDHDP
jgi:hypothetical protein